MNIENMTTDELWALHAQVSKKLGLYSMMAVSVADVKDRLQEMLTEGLIKTMPSAAAIEQACAYVWRKYEGDWMETVEWCADVAIENAIAGETAE